ncbi:extracellular solute-binding protein, family 1 [Paenibacillus algicola]|uniref:Extracellular solute-binding protein, family 1 n=1 Tax=Paenibacillus algicola TaxID=2565926 RepID=A0A4P8XPG4_9BACL|nr:extracellular solute-binding protein [Paenibacillus algicola]QCT03670.1 extracellular solute-binding protein, family 1 [Paenibacillus algicola]
MKRKIRSKALLTLTLLTSMFVSACSGNGTGTTGSDSSSGADGQEATPQASGEVVEIVAWDMPQDGDPAKPYWEQVFKDFAEKHPNIKVEHVMQTLTKEREQFMTAVVGGKQPDLYANAFPDMESYIDQGIAADITELWNNYAEKDQILPSAMQAATRDGKIYGIPNLMYVTGLAYNKQMFADAGLDPKEALKDWESFGEAAQKLSDPSKNQYGYALLGMDWADWFFEYYVWQAGGDLTERQEDGSVKLTFTSEPAVQALQYYQDLKFKYNATQKNVVQSLDENSDDFYQNRAASMIAASNWFGGMVSAGMDIENIGFSALPPGPGGSSPAQVGGAVMIFNPKATPEKQQAAFTYATYIVSKEVQDGLLQYQMDNGIFPNLLNVRSDVDASQFVEGMPEELIQNVQNAAQEGRLEYFLKARLSPYVVKAVQQVLMDESADPMKVMQEAQDLAQREVVDKYNKEIKK